MATETTQEVELRSEALTLQQRSAIRISDQPSYDQAVEVLTAVKSFRKHWTQYWDPIRDGAYRSYKNILDKIKEHDDPMAQAEGTLKREILRWDDEQRRLQEEKQREEQRKAEEAAEALRVQQSVEAEAEGATDEEIKQLMSAPVLAVAPPVQPTYQRASSVTRRDNWGIEITDLKALLKAIGGGKLKLSAEDSAELKSFMEGLLKPRAVSDKETLNIAGCKAVNRPIIASRGGK
jgi:hypothetical protein